MVRVEYAITDNFYKIEVKGHADYAEKGKDIVCAGVSALVGALQMYFERTVKLSDASYIAKSIGDGFAHFAVENVNDSQADFELFIAFRMCIMGLEAIEEKYPDYISISDISFLYEDSDIDTPEQTEKKKGEEEKA